MKTHTQQFYYTFGILILMFFSCTHIAAQSITTLSPSSDYNNLINEANPGDIFEFQAGVYGKLDISNVNGNENNPIILRRKNVNGAVFFEGQYDNIILFGNGSGFNAADIRNCRYIAFDGLSFRKGKEGVHVFGCEYLIFNDCEISDTGQVGIKFSSCQTGQNTNCTDYSEFIDWIGGKVSNTGNTQDGPYGEGFYIGQAGQNLDFTHDIWVEGVQIFNINGGEAVDVKPDVFNITIKNNIIDNVEVYAVQGVAGKTTQVNSGAIQVIASDGTFKPNDRTDGHHELWIENNTITNVTAKAGNTNPDRGNGVSVIGRAGVYLKNNTITNIEHDGVYGFDNTAQGGLDPGYDLLIDTATFNQISVSPGRGKVAGPSNVVLNAPIGGNPFSRQQWYPPTANDGTPPPSETFPNIESSTAGSQSDNPPSGLIDGSIAEDDRWSINGLNTSNKQVTIDYGSTKSFIGARLWTLQNRSYQYRIEVSNSTGSGFSTVVDRTGNTASQDPFVDNFGQATGRYVRLTVTGLFGSTSTWASIRELEMIESTTPPVGNPLTGTFYLKNRDSGKRLSVTSAGKGALLELGSATGTGNDFEFDISEVPNDQGMYFIKINGFAIRNNDCETVQGTFVETHDGDGDCTRWEIIEKGNFYNLKNKNSQLFARNDDCQDQDGNEIELTTGTGGCAQWTLEPVSGVSAFRTIVPNKFLDVSEEKNFFSVYPNPSSDTLIINAQNRGASFSYSLTTLAGQVVRNGDGLQNKAEINVNSLHKGLYILIYESGGKKVQKKIYIN